jgi:hypothetical protein
MIVWKDFIFDEVLGPLLECPQLEPGSRSFDDRTSVMEDAEIANVDNVQEARREQRPARMVGTVSLDSNLTGREACRTESIEIPVSVLDGERG